MQAGCWSPSNHLYCLTQAQTLTSSWPYSTTVWIWIIIAPAPWDCIFIVCYRLLLASFGHRFHAFPLGIALRCHSKCLRWWKLAPAAHGFREALVNHRVPRVLWAVHGQARLKGPWKVRVPCWNVSMRFSTQDWDWDGCVWNLYLC